MKIPVIALGLLLAGPRVGATSEPLPDWADPARQTAGWVPGAELLGPENVSVPELPPLTESNEEPLPSFAEIPNAFLNDYFAERPASLLVDPQNLLSKVDHDKRLGFLTYHAGDSAIDLVVYLIPGDQEVPSEVREEELGERLFSSGRPSVAILYFFGAPERTRLHLSPSLAVEIPISEQRQVLENCVIQAMEKAAPTEQLERFLVQMSIRSYLLERMIADPEFAGHRVAKASLAQTKAKKPEKESAALVWARPLIEKYGVLALLGVLIMAVVWGMSLWLRGRTRYRFPDFEVEPRLGGAHAAGIGAVISFASAAVPPASQRTQVPDYLRRA